MRLQWLSTGMTWRILPSNVQCSRGCEGQSQLAQSPEHPHTASRCGLLTVWGFDSGVGGRHSKKSRQSCMVLAYLSLEFIWHPFSSVLFSQYSSGSRREMTSLPSLHRRLARSHCITICGNEITRCDLPSKLQPATRMGQTDGPQ